MRTPRIPPFGLNPVMFVAIVAFAVLTDSASAIEDSDKSTIPEPRRPFAARGRLPELPPVPDEARQTQARATLFAETGRLPASANSAAIEPATCSTDARSFGIPVVCGYVPVPLDWSHPGNPEKIEIYFELYTPNRSGPAESAMLMNWGGPGSSTTGNRFPAFYHFRNNLDKHDLLLIDDRGRGLSGAISCAHLQHGTVPFAQAEAECAAQLGVAASRYGTGEIAQDTEAVRAALGYDKVDYFGWSYGGADVEAYATRFGQHLRSIVLDSPLGSPAFFQFDFNHARTQAESRTVRLACLRSPTCAPDHPFPTTGSDALDRTLRNDPVEGDASETSANQMHGRFDEGGLLGHPTDRPKAHVTGSGELAVAAPPLWPGNFVPVQRPGELEALVWTIRNNPVEGDAYDASGGIRHVRIDEEALLGYVIDYSTGRFTSTGELLAAARALRNGDSAPLLRLGAESYSPLDGADSGDPTSFSLGAYLATWAADFDSPWSWSAPVSTRQEQYDSAVTALPWEYFEPFSTTAATNNLVFDFVLQSLWWEMPTAPSPVVPPYPTYPHVPTLVLSGDLDKRVPLEITRKVARLYPESVFVPVAGAGHVAVSWSNCAGNLASGFIRTLTVGDTTCAIAPETVWPAVGRFPLHAGDAVPAEIDTTGGNTIGIDERRVVTVAVAAATDAMQRMYIGSGNGVGLRGGTFRTRYSDLNPLTVTLTDCAFTEDVTVSGTASWWPGAPAWMGAPGDLTFRADLTVSGSGTKGGTIHVEGKWQAPGPPGHFKVTGTLGGNNVAVLVPSA